MSFFDRLNRFVDSFDNISNDEKVKFGMEGERIAKKAINHKDGLILNNPIIPHPNNKDKFLETDMIVYKNGRIYCIEVKNYKGKITFKPIYEDKYVEKRFLFFFKFKVLDTVLSKWDDSVIIKTKVGNYKEGTFTNEYQNPMKKTKNYIYNLKGYLRKTDCRFNGLFVIPVVAFNRKNSDISAIHSFEEGYIYIDEIKKYIEKTSSINEDNQLWIINGLSELPSWDTLITSNKEEIYGVIKGDFIILRNDNGNAEKLSLSNILYVKLERGKIFSKEDIATVTFVDGRDVKYKNIDGVVTLDKFGELQKHNISNLNYIDVGTHSLRKNNYL